MPSRISSPSTGEDEGEGDSGVVEAVLFPLTLTLPSRSGPSFSHQGREDNPFPLPRRERSDPVETPMKSEIEVRVIRRT